MVTIGFEGIKDINVDISSFDTHIDFEMKAFETVSTTRLEISASDAKYLYEKLKEKFE